MDRERQFIEEIQSVLPEFAHACSSRSDFIIMSQEAFAPRLSEYEILILGKAIKYTGLMGRSEGHPFAAFGFLNVAPGQRPGRALHGLCEQLVCSVSCAHRVSGSMPRAVRRARKLFSYFPISPMCAIVSPFFSDGTAPM